MRLFLVVCMLMPKVLLGQDATINFSHKKIIIESNSRYSGTHNYKVTVHNKKGRDFATYHDFEDKFRNVNAFKMLLLDEQGNKIEKYSKEDLTNYSFDASYHIDDTQSLYLKPKYDTYPFTVEVEVKWVCKGFLGLPTWVPRYAFGLAVEKASFEVMVPKDINLRTSGMNGLDNGNPKPANKDVLYSWEVNGLEAIADDMDYQLFFEQQPKALIAPEIFEMDGYRGSTASWKEFGQFIYELNMDRDDLLPDTKAFLGSLDPSNKIAAIRKVYQYMQDRTRYVSIQLGIGGWQTIPSDQVDEKGYGDCKALTYYTMAMLDYIGIPSNGVLVKAGRDVADVNYEFSSNQFNHIFLGVPLDSDTVFLECTSQTQPFDYLGTFTDDRHVLWLEDGNSRIIKSPTYNELVNFQDTKSVVTLDKEGNAIVELKSTNNGIFSDSHNYFSQLGKQRFKLYAQKLFDYSDFAIMSMDLDSMDRLKPQYASQYTLKVTQLATLAAENILIPVNLLNPIGKFLKYSRYDEYAEVKRSFRVKEDVDLILPEGIFIQSLPESIHLENDYGTYHLEVIRNDTNIQLIREFKFNKGEYKEDDFSEFYRYIRKVSKIEKKYIVLNDRT